MRTLLFFIFLDYISHCYSDKHEEHSFDKKIIASRIDKLKQSKEAANAMKEELAKEQQKSAILTLKARILKPSNSCKSDWLKLFWKSLNKELAGAPPCERCIR